MDSLARPLDPKSELQSQGDDKNRKEERDGEKEIKKELTWDEVSNPLFKLIKEKQDMTDLEEAVDGHIRNGAQPGTIECGKVRNARESRRFPRGLFGRIFCGGKYRREQGKGTRECLIREAQERVEARLARCQQGRVEDRLRSMEAVLQKLEKYQEQHRKKHEERKRQKKDANKGGDDNCRHRHHHHHHHRHAHRHAHHSFDSVDLIGQIRIDERLGQMINQPSGSNSPDVGINVPSMDDDIDDPALRYTIYEYERGLERDRQARNAWLAENGSLGRDELESEYRRREQEADETRKKWLEKLPFEMKEGLADYVKDKRRKKERTHELIADGNPYDMEAPPRSPPASEYDSPPETDYSRLDPSMRRLASISLGEDPPPPAKQPPKPDGDDTRYGSKSQQAKPAEHSRDESSKHQAEPEGRKRDESKKPQAEPEGGGRDSARRHRGEPEERSRRYSRRHHHGDPEVQSGKDSSQYDSSRHSGRRDQTEPKERSHRYLRRH